MNGSASHYPTTSAEIAAQFALANEAASRALAIAPKLGSAYGVLALIDQNRLNFPGSLEHLKKALALSPDNPEVLSSATTLLPYLGDAEEALRLTDRFIALDPLNPTAYRRKSEVLYVLRQYAQSIEIGRKSVELASSTNVRHWIGGSLVLMGRPREALAEYVAMPAGDVFRLTGEALVAAQTGDAAGVERQMGVIRKQFGATASYQYAEIYSRLGQKDRAFAELNNAVAAKDPGLVYLKVDPFLDPIRDDPRYAALVRKLNFP